MNLYAYSHNDPLNKFDPSGKNTVVGAVAGCAATGPGCPAGAAVGAIVGTVVAVAGVAAISNAVSNESAESSSGDNLPAVENDSAPAAPDQLPAAGDKSPSTPTGQRGSPMDVPRGTNTPTTINDREYTGHALDQGQGRGIPPSAVEDAVQNGTSSPGNRPGTTVHVGENGVTVVTGERGQVITVIQK